MSLARRDFLRLLAGTAGTTVLTSLTGCGGNASSQQPISGTLNDSRTKVQNIVVVMMENRSFDHLLGWLPGADGRQAGLTYPEASGQLLPTWRLENIYRACSMGDPNHTYQGGRQTYNNGAMNGFLQAEGNDKFAIGYYAEQDLPFHAALARSYTTCDRYFASILGPTIPNRLFLHAGQTDTIEEQTGICTLPTIWDSLAAAGVPATYYYSNYSYLGFWGSKYDAISAPTENFFSQASAGTLPAVSFVEPTFSLQGNSDDGQDQHPNADIRRGEQFLANIYQAVTQGPSWNNTVLVVTYDEWGGFFDHVPPPRVIAPNNVDPDLVNGKALLGFRVPVTVVSPFTRASVSAPTVSSTLFDHTSILKLIEWRWGLAPLTARDAGAEIGNLASLLNFSLNPAPAPAIPIPASPPSISCASQPNS